MMQNGQTYYVTVCLASAKAAQDTQEHRPANALFGHFVKKWKWFSIFSFGNLLLNLF